MRIYCLAVFIFLVISGNGFLIINKTAGTAVKGNSAANGMVVSASRQASTIGVDIMKKGGNAVDAAVATGFALAVCYPEAGNLGGGGFMVISMADGRSEVLDYREKAPLAASRDMYLDKSGNVVEGLSTETDLASGVPGSVDGLLEAHRKYGRIPLDLIIQPAIDLANNGYPLTAGQAESLNNARDYFLRKNRNSTAFVKDSIWKEGEVLVQNELAATLTLIRDKGRSGFYSGKTASMIINEMKHGNGIITVRDLNEYKPVWRIPLDYKYNGLTILTVPPPSGGGITLLQVLKMAELNGIDRTSFHSPASIHLLIEAERRAFADRSFFAGDADYVHVPVNKLLDSGYLERRMKDFDLLKATPSNDIEHGLPENPEPEETTHYSAMDREGNAVSVTTTLNGTFGNGIVVEGAGFILNNEMDDFSIKPGFPNMYGLTGGEANSISPGKRILSSMTPVIILKDKKPFLVAGSPGGSTIPTTVLQIIINVVNYGMNIQSAVDAGRFHHQWIPDLVYFENNTFENTTLAKLQEMGYKLKMRSSIGSVNAIMRLEDGTLQSGADPRGNNVAAGY